MRSFLVAPMLLLVVGAARAQTTASSASPEASTYLETALDFIEQKSRVYSTDWKVLREKARAAIARSGAKTPADTYPAIREALSTVGDKHGLLLDATAAKAFNPARTAKATGLLVAPLDAAVALVVSGSPAAAAGLVVGDRIVAVEGLDELASLSRREFGRLFRSGHRPDGNAAPLDLRVRTGKAEPRAVQVPLAAFDSYSAPTGLRLEGGIAYVELPGLASGPKAAGYDDTLHELLDRFDEGTLRGCIVDLRRNTGGSVWPMLAGIGPLA